MDKKIKETIENKFAVVLDDLLLPKALGTTVNPIIQGTDKRYIFYYLAKKQDNILLIYGSWKDTDDNGEPYKYTEELKGHFSKEDKENLLTSLLGFLIDFKRFSLSSFEKCPLSSSVYL